jgi:integral membrane protein
VRVSNPITSLHKIALIEGISFLVLLFIAMPLKYFAGMPMAVKVVGWAHGILFVLFGLALLRAMIAGRWPLFRAALVFVGGLVPFGPFLLHGRMREYEAEYLSLQRLRC